MLVPLEDGPSRAEVRTVAAKVVEEVVRMASHAAQAQTEEGDVERQRREKIRAMQRLPTIQIDTVPSMPPSPCESPEHEHFVDESEVTLELQSEQKLASSSSNHVEASTSSWNPSGPQVSITVTEAPLDESEVREVAEQVVQEVVTKAVEMANERMAAEAPRPAMVKFDDAPEDLKEFVSNYVKDIVTKAISIAEEKKVRTAQFNFEDVDLRKTSGPWYIRAREALVRILRSACFCTPRRHDS